MNEWRNDLTKFHETMILTSKIQWAWRRHLKMQKECWMRLKLSIRTKWWNREVTIIWLIEWKRTWLLNRLKQIVLQRVSKTNKTFCKKNLKSRKELENCTFKASLNWIISWKTLIMNKKRGKRESEVFKIPLRTKRKLFSDEWKEQINRNRSLRKLLLKIKIQKKSRNEKF